jgi:hypothetical protein
VVIGGITTIDVIPVKLVPLMFEPWQATQLVVMPVWLNSDLVNLDAAVTGNCKLLPEPT